MIAFAKKPMENPTLDDGSGHHERIARVVWAVHILSYLATEHSQTKLLQLRDAAEEEEENLDHEELDSEAEKKAVLQGSRESIRRKFLDCIAQLFSQRPIISGVPTTTR